MKILLILLLAYQVQGGMKINSVDNHYTFRNNFIPLIVHLPEMTSLIIDTRHYEDLNRVELMMAMDHLHIHLLIQPHFVYYDGRNLKARPILWDNNIIKQYSEWTGPPHRLVLPQAKYIWPYDTFERLPRKDQERIADFAEKLKTMTVGQVLRLFDNAEVQ